MSAHFHSPEERVRATDLKTENLQKSVSIGCMFVARIAGALSNTHNHRTIATGEAVATKRLKLPTVPVCAVARIDKLLSVTRLGIYFCSATPTPPSTPGRSIWPCRADAARSQSPSHWR